MRRPLKASVKRLSRVLAEVARGTPPKRIAYVETVSPRWIQRLIRVHVKKI